MVQVRILAAERQVRAGPEGNPDVGDVHLGPVVAGADHRERDEGAAAAALT